MIKMLIIKYKNSSGCELKEIDGLSYVSVLINKF